MTRQGKRGLLEAIRPRYLRASRVQKGRMLDEFVAATGYNWKHASHLLCRGRCEFASDPALTAVERGVLPGPLRCQTSTASGINMNGMKVLVAIDRPPATRLVGTSSRAGAHPRSAMV